MDDKVRLRKQILEKIDEDRDLNLDGMIEQFSLIVEQDEFLSYMREDLIKQRKIWKVCAFLAIYCSMLILFYLLS